MMLKIKSTLSIGLIAVFLCLSNQSTAQSNGFEIIKGMELMDQIYEHLEKYYVDDIKAGNLSKTAIDAMLKELDPYTVYYHESNIEDYRLLTTGQYGGIGALIRKNGDFVYIAEPYQGNPAETSGLKAGDKILEIDGKSMKEKSSSEVSTALKGPKGTSVDVKIERNGSNVKTITVNRNEIKLPDVPYSGLLDNKVGYIKLNGFTQTASTDVKKAFIELKEQGMESLVLDLRGNGGGLLIEAVRIVNMFVKRGQVVVSTKGRVESENHIYMTTEEPMDLDIPLVVLMNGGSASASEIVAGSLQDLDRAVIIGTTSYGKGLVQRTYDLDYGSKVKLTIAKYYTPSGRCVQRLEYYDREDGKRPEEIADSLITIFKTTNGRDVIDGRGVEPDIEVEPQEFSRLTATVFRNNFVFDYATEYYYAHTSIDSASIFKLTDAEYEDFKAYVLKQDFTYSTASEEMLKKMKEAAEAEGFYEDASAEYDALLQKVVPSKERDLEKFKSELTELLENEIVSRYFYQNGRAEHAFNYDEYMTEVSKIFQDSKEYNTILGN
ncbi:MAG: S41 family peptidase [Crocinitomicaceae bacterium]|nr:S41 family peptidase [Flavobacteriales bacterium]NQZ35788.1 S41 family peptidase [Crocinitomicaceae bacterium]